MWSTLQKRVVSDKVVTVYDDEDGKPETKTFGYARVSTEDQNLDLQIKALTEYGVDRIFKEKKSALAKKRVQLELLKKYLHPGDTLVVWKLDRLGRDVMDLIKMMNMLKKRNVNFVSLTDHIDTTTAMGSFIFHLMAALAQLERDMTVERTKAGMAAARARGWKPGPKDWKERTPSDVLSSIRKDLKNPKMSWQKLHEKYGISVTTLRKHLLEERRRLMVEAAEKENTE